MGICTKNTNNFQRRITKLHIEDLNLPQFIYLENTDEKWESPTGFANGAENAERNIWIEQNRDYSQSGWKEED